MIKDILGSLPGCVGEATTMLIIFSGLSGIKGKKKAPNISRMAGFHFYPTFMWAYTQRTNRLVTGLLHIRITSDNLLQADTVKWSYVDRHL